MRHVFAGIAGLIAVCLPGAAQAVCDPGELTIKFSHVVAEKGHPKGEMAAALAARINTEMNGSACMEVYPSSELYDDDAVMEALLLGEVQIAAPSISKLEDYTLKYRLFDLPFLFSDMQAVNVFIESEIGNSLLNEMSDYGFVGIGYMLNGLKQFSANKVLEIPKDAEGLAFRVQTSDVAVSMIETLNARPVKLPFKDVFYSLETGLVDGQENTWSNIYTQRLFTVQDGVLETNHQLLIYLAVVSQEWLEGLDPAIRATFLKIFKEVSGAYNARAMEINAESRSKIIRFGGVVRGLTPVQRKEWVSAMAPVWAKYQDQIGLDVIEAAVNSNASN
ncbi:DctP family TRAP transporter solute-binding subunit [Roseibium denhamense]|uniref:C4-dicarboxylate-binding protein DctP n=1 Tax=Roseibium denhamense TaxID=76305 RepID=A0ABY1PCG4_9HYPH|nr:DctP family TRAP transporter solute-binding subunit [Roseibium denhamense]MTI04577.1 DctP family TRAP transporter solute-binding subunit [Roseibium denhamense]SMP31174.1 C4-dicarboxylate-binding protein DctP [Roseibium denhamense]